MSQRICYAAEQSAATPGFVGQVKDLDTDKVLLRTALVWPTAHEAITAARNLWAARAQRIQLARMHAAAGLQA